MVIENNSNSCFPFLYFVNANGECGLQHGAISLVQSISFPSVANGISAMRDNLSRIERFPRRDPSPTIGLDVRQMLQYNRFARTPEVCLRERLQ